MNHLHNSEIYDKVTVLIVGEPGPTKEDFLKGDFLHYELKNALLRSVDTQYADREAVKEVLAKSSEALKNMCAPEQKRTVPSKYWQARWISYLWIELVLTALKNGEWRLR